MLLRQLGLSLSPWSAESAPPPHHLLRRAKLALRRSSLPRASRTSPEHRRSSRSMPQPPADVAVAFSARAALCKLCRAPLPPPGRHSRRYAPLDPPECPAHLTQASARLDRARRLPKPPPLSLISQYSGWCRGKKTTVALFFVF